MAYTHAGRIPPTRHGTVTTRIRPPLVLLLLIMTMLALSEASGTTTSVIRAPPDTASSSSTSLPIIPLPAGRKYGDDSSFARTAAGKLTRCIGQQSKDTAFRTPKEHVHRNFLKQTFGRTPPSLSLSGESPRTQDKAPVGRTTTSFSRLCKVALAGGIAGATGTAVLFPVDSAKTLRQSAPDVYRNVRHALWRLIRTSASTSSTSTTAGAATATRWHIGRAYCGVVPATLGAIPSSALYFGAYETVKPILKRSCPREWKRTRTGRGCIHAGAAAAGNVLSSTIFVPKEVIKQHMQYAGGSVGRAVSDILRTNGIRGLYSGYSATLLRNIPSAVLRFTIYEELKQIFVLENEKETKKTGFNWKLFAAGAVAGTVSSGLMTPVDVIKTRMATGTCPVDMPGCIQHVIAEGGLTGLYMGAGSRIVWSTVFAAIGFGMLETAKGWLGVTDGVIPTESAAAVGTSKPLVDSRPKQEYKMFSRHQRSLEHAVSDKYE